MKNKSLWIWLQIVLKWICFFLFYAISIVVLGAIGGMLAFLLLGKLFMPDMTFVELGLKGLRVGAIYAGVWASGVSIVLCFMKGHREAQISKS